MRVLCLLAEPSVQSNNKGRPSNQANGSQNVNQAQGDNNAQAAGDGARVINNPSSASTGAPARAFFMA